MPAVDVCTFWLSLKYSTAKEHHGIFSLDHRVQSSPASAEHFLIIWCK